MPSTSTEHQGRSGELLKGRKHPSEGIVGLMIFGLALVLLGIQPSTILYHWDSVNFAFAMEAFNLAKEQPQPPGYLLYVLLARVVDSVVQDPPRTLVLISLVAGALAVALMYVLGARLFGRRAGFVAALGMLSSPLLNLYARIALPHALDMALTIAAGLLFLEVLRGNDRSLYPGIVLIALAGGFRPQTLVFLLPAVLFAMLRVRWGKWLVGGLLGAAVCLAWAVPLLQMSGGLQAYLETMRLFSERFQTTTDVLGGAGWFGLIRNLTKLSLYTGFAWGFMALLFPAGLLAWWLRSDRRVSWRVTGFLLLWLATPALYYALVHMGQPGLVLIFLPVLVLCSAWGAEKLFNLGWRGPAMAAVVFLAGLNLLTFWVVPEYPSGAQGQRFLTHDSIRNTDAYFQQRIARIRGNFDPADTAIIAANWHHVNYYLPQYRVIPFTIGSKREADEGMAVNPQESFSATWVDLGMQTGSDGTGNLVLFDPALLGFIGQGTQNGDAFHPTGEGLYLFALRPGDLIGINEGRILLPAGIQTKP